MKQWMLAALGLVAFATVARAQDITVSAQAQPQQVAAGETVTLVVTVEGKTNINGEPALPDLPDFQVYGGGRSSNFTFINGQVSSSLQFTYMLVPKRAGQFTIGAIKITQSGKVYATAPITVTVGGAGTAAPATAAPGAAAAPEAPAPRGHTGEAAFITTAVDRRAVYVNEPLTLTFRFFSRVPVLAQPQYQPPDLTGFWSEDLPPQRQYVTQVNGQDYNVIEIKTALFPTTAGKLTIGPARLVVQVEDFNRSGADPFADNFFRGFFASGRPVELRSQPLPIAVRAVPQAGRPAAFSGTVGQWSISARLDRSQAKVGEAVTLEVRIFGEGNVKAVSKPELPVLTGFRVYDTISSSEVKKTAGRVQGVKTYRTLLRPIVTGTLSLPPIKYAYFDPQAGRFEQVAVPSLSLQVLPGEASAGGGAVPALNAAPSEIKVVSQDIRYVKTEFPLTPAPRPWPPVAWWLGFGLPLLLLLGAWGWQWHQDRLAADPVYARRLAAASRSRRALSHAHQARLRRDPAAFYAALSQALVGFLADQLGLSRAGVTQRELLLRLETAGVDADRREKLAALLTECDYARFAPGDRAEADLLRHEQEAEAMLTDLANRLRKEKRA